MSGENDYIYKIGIVGPTRVGKTSLIASLLKDAQLLLQGTPVNIAPHGPKTERRIAQHQKELDGSIRAGEFNSGAVSGTEESFTYELYLDTGVTGAGIRLCLLDYPGGWIDSSRRPVEREEHWKACKDWMKKSSVLIVPVESAVMMEADSARLKKAVSYILNTYEVEGIVREWAKERAAHPDEPSLLIFCPVKCESYYADNGGLLDASDELYSAFQDHYHEVLKAAKGEAPQLKLLYIPVDTIGCVEIIKANWQEHGKDPADLVFSADYRVRKPKRQTVKGADAVMVSLCQNLVDAKKRIEKVIVTKLERKADDDGSLAEKDEGVLGNFWYWLTRERKRREKEADTSRTDYKTRRMIVESLEKVIDRLATRELGPRVRIL